MSRGLPAVKPCLQLVLTADPQLPLIFREAFSASLPEHPPSSLIKAGTRRLWAPSRSLQWASGAACFIKCSSGACAPSPKTRPLISCDSAKKTPQKPRAGATGPRPTAGSAGGGGVPGGGVLCILSMRTGRPLAAAAGCSPPALGVGVPASQPDKDLRSPRAKPASFLCFSSGHLPTTHRPIHTPTLACLLNSGGWGGVGAGTTCRGTAEASQSRRKVEGRAGTLCWAVSPLRCCLTPSTRASALWPYR